MKYCGINHRFPVQRRPDRTTLEKATPSFRLQVIDKLGAVEAWISVFDSLTIGRSEGDVTFTERSCIGTRQHPHFYRSTGRCSLRILARGRKIHSSESPEGMRCKVKTLC